MIELIKITKISPQLKFYYKNRDKILDEKKKVYQEMKKDLVWWSKILEKNRKWNKKNPNYHNEYTKKRYSSDPIFRKKICEYYSYKKKNDPKYKFYNIKAHHKRRILEKNSLGNFSKEEWLELLKKYKYCCVFCGKSDKISIDHIIPLSKGGTNFINNLQPLCRSCNSKKSNKLPCELKFKE